MKKEDNIKNSTLAPAMGRALYAIATRAPMPAQTKSDAKSPFNEPGEGEAPTSAYNLKSCATVM